MNKVIDGLYFEMTCEACPEQYDVLKYGELVGYVRLRWGGLSCSYHDVGGEEVYYHDFRDDPWKGAFKDDEERMEHLEMIAKALNNKLNSTNF